MNYYIGLDLSLTHTGVIILAAGQIVKNVTLKPESRGMERLLYIEKKIEELVNIPPSLVCIEGYAYGAFRGLAELGELGGIIKTTLYRNRIPFLTVAPTTLKKWITGSGRGEKNQIMLKAFQKWGVNLDDEHQYDAYGLARIAYSIGEKPELEKYEQEVIKTVTALAR